MKSHLSNKVSKIIFIVLFAILTALSAVQMVLRFTILKPLDMYPSGDTITNIILVVCEFLALICALFMDKNKAALRATISFYSLGLIFLILDGIIAMDNEIRLEGNNTIMPMIAGLIISIVPLIFIIPYFVFYVKWSYGRDTKIKGRILGLGITSLLVLIVSEFGGCMSTKFVIADKADNRLLLFIPMIFILFNALVLIFSMVHKFDPNEVRPVKVKKVKEPKPKKIKEPKPVKVKEPKPVKVKEPKVKKVKEPKVKKVKETLVAASVNEEAKENTLETTEEIINDTPVVTEPVISAASKVEAVASEVIEEPKTEPVVEEKPVINTENTLNVSSTSAEEITSENKERKPSDKPQLVLERHMNNSTKKRSKALLFCFFFGAFGVHRFYVGKVGTGILYIFTFGGFFLGSLCDLILLVFRGFRDKQGYVLRDED